ncbi:MAG: metallophosphoesterase [Xanthomonadales bacterium]|nr:metallophosphoesterase [Xanthomonadales bacterium]
MRLVHLTDPHLSSLDDVRMAELRGKRWSGYLSWRKNRRKRYLPAILEELTAAVRAEAADQILVTGDLVHIGLEAEIKQAAGWLSSLGPAEQVMLVPGNHDYYVAESSALFNHAWSDYLFLKGKDRTFPVLRKFGGVSLVGLSSARATPVFMASGRLGDAQLDATRVVLEQAADEGQMVVVLIHHPPLPGMTSSRKALADAHNLRNLLEQYPPALVMHGHLHHNREQLWGETRVCCTAAASSIADASYRVIDIEESGADRTLRMVLKSVEINERGELSFAKVDEQTWQI